MKTSVIHIARFLRTARLLKLLVLLLALAPLLAVAGPPSVNPAKEPALAHAGPGQPFMAISLNDIAATPGKNGEDRLRTFFDWVAGNGMHAISLDDIERAQRGEQALPPNAVLLTFDNGYRALYDRVFPLALAHHVPIVAPLVGKWIENDHDGRFVNWQQARQMQASGLVEFASAGYALHDAVTTGPDGSRLPAAIARRYQPGIGYESDAAYQARLRADLQHSRELFRRELGHAPRALAWPCGPSPQAALAAHELGFRFTFTLQPQLANTARPMAIGRYQPLPNIQRG